jgi:Tol biopolymer transport system component/predicted amidohydrolase
MKVKLWHFTGLFVLPLTFMLAKEGEPDSLGNALPMEPTRTVAFTTDEGTWLSLDVSPDGKTIIFELLGDLYTLPYRGGKATRITSGMAFDSQPSYSPDGEWIAFLSDRDGAENIWIAKADGGEPKQLSKDGNKSFASPAWTPDGDYVVVSRSGWGTFELWMYHMKGGSGVQITKSRPSGETPRNRQHNALGAAFSPDGKFIYYARKFGGFSYNAQFPMWQIARRNMVTGDEDILTRSEGSGIRPTISPDGKTLVYATRYQTKTGLRIRDLESAKDEWLIYPVQRDDQESRFTRDLLPGYTFHPNGREVILSYGGQIQRVDVRNGKSRRIPFEAEVEQELGPDLNFPYRVSEGAVRSRIIMDPTQSTDGKHLAFSTFTHLYTMALPDGTPKRVTSKDLGEFQPSWSPDGRWLAFVTWTHAGGHIWKVRARGGSPVKLTKTAAFYAEPVWTPDGETIVVLRGSAYQRIKSPSEFGGPNTPMDLISIDANGGDAKLILPARGLGKPHFIDGEEDRIYLYSRGGGIVSVRFDGTDRRQHLSVKGKGNYSSTEPVPARDARLSPDGRWALASVQNQLYFLAVPYVGGSAPMVNVSSPSVPVKKLTNIGADYFGWSDGGKTVTWAIGATYHRMPVDSISFEPSKEEAKDEEKKTENEKKPFLEEATFIEKIEVVVEKPRYVPKGTIVLTGGRIITMDEKLVIEDGEIVVTGNRISQVGRRGTTRIPEDASVVDISGKTVIPGLIDTHAHWMEVRKGVLDLQNWSFLANVAYGVTTGLDVQTSTNDVFAYQDLVETGQIVGPRAFNTGPGIFSNNNFQSMEEAKGVIKRYRDHYRTKNLKSYVVGNRKQRQFVAMAAYELGMMPTTEGALDLKLDITHAIDGFHGNEHALPIVPLYKDVVELLARGGMTYTPTLLVAYGGPWAENYYYTTTEVHDSPKVQRFIPDNIIQSRTRRRPWFREDEHVFPKLAEEAAKVARAGGRVGVGAHGQLQGIGYHWELWALQSGGMSEMEALLSATLHGAEIIGVGQDLGSIEKGKLADLIVLDKNPLDNIRNTNSVRYVMANGELFEGDTMNKQWPSEKELEPLWWWDDGPDGK